MDFLEFWLVLVCYLQSRIVLPYPVRFSFSSTAYASTRASAAVLFGLHALRYSFQLNLPIEFFFVRWVFFVRYAVVVCAHSETFFSLAMHFADNVSDCAAIAIHSVCSFSTFHLLYIGICMFQSKNMNRSDFQFNDQAACTVFRLYVVRSCYSHFIALLCATIFSCWTKEYPHSIVFFSPHAHFPAFVHPVLVPA